MWLYGAFVVVSGQRSLALFITAGIFLKLMNISRGGEQRKSIFEIAATQQKISFKFIKHFFCVEWENRIVVDDYVNERCYWLYVKTNASDHKSSSGWWIASESSLSRFPSLINRFQVSLSCQVLFIGLQKTFDYKCNKSSASNEINNWETLIEQKHVIKRFAQKSQQGEKLLSVGLECLCFKQGTRWLASAQENVQKAIKIVELHVEREGEKQKLNGLH